jgi:hypothetical protein
MNFYSYTTQTPDAPGQIDEPLGGGARSIDRGRMTLTAVINRNRKVWPDQSFKVFTFHNFYDDRTFKLVHTERAPG